MAASGSSTRVLVTGGSGFIGENLAAWLSRTGFDVLTPSREEMDLVDDESVHKWMRGHPVHTVIHAATTPAHRNIKSPEGVAYKNLRMFLNLSRNRDCYSRLIVLGSGSEYDARHYQPKMSEDHFGTHIPTDESGFSKYSISKFVEAMGERFLVLRLFGVFGPGEEWEIRFISNAICKALFDRPITIKQDRRFDYLWIEDLGPIVKHFIQNDSKRRALNVTPGEPVDLSALAKMVLEVSKKKLPIRIAVPGMGPEYTADNRRLLEEMPGVRFTPVRDAVAALWEWYAAHRDLVDPKALEQDK